MYNHVLSNSCMSSCFYFNKILSEKKNECTGQNRFPIDLNIYGEIIFSFASYYTN